MTSSIDNEIVTTSNLHYVREVTAKYIGRRRKFTQISDPAEAVAFMRPLLKDNFREHFIALYLNGSQAITAYSLVSIGLLNSTVVHPREVFRGAILTGSRAIIIGHNHPSGNLTPSDEDMKVTRQLKDAGKIIGIELLDHVVFSDSDFVSFQAEGRL